jgi:hypothetical protein
MMIISRAGKPTKRNIKSKAPVQASNRSYNGDASRDILGYSSGFTVLPLIFMRTMSNQDTIQTG